MIEKWFLGSKALFFILLAYVFGLWAFSVPLTGDQKTYISIAMEMRDRSEWVIPYLFDRANFLKPPFQYWATILGWKLFGFNLFGALLPSVLALIASAYWIKRISKAKDDVPPLLLAGTLATMTYATTSQMEIWILAFYLAAWGFWIEGKTWKTLITVGVMSAIKGPLYPALFVLSVFFEACLKRDFSRVLKWRFILALVTGVLLGLLWYGLAARTHLNEMLAMFFLKENVGKIHTQHGTPWGLWAEFIGTLFPIVIAFVFTFLTPDFREAWRNQKILWLSYGLIPALFFTLFPYRVNTYLYLLTPLVVLAMDQCRGGLRVHAKKMAIVSALLGLVLTLFLARLCAGKWLSEPLMIVYILVIILWVYSHLRANLHLLGLASILLVNLIRLTAVEIGEWDLKGLRSFLKSDPSEVYYVMDQEDIWHEYGLVSAAVQRRIHVLPSREMATQHLKSGDVILFNDEQSTWAEGYRCQDWVRLKKRIKFPLAQLMRDGLSIEDASVNRHFKICKI
jgi:hypothetical protein